MYDNYNKLTTKQQQALLTSINKNYTDATKDINKRIKKIQGESGKQQRQSIKAITPLIVALWGLNAKEVIVTSETVMSDTWIYYEYVANIKLGNKRIIMTNQDIAKMINKTLAKRGKVIKWDRVINGNTKRLDKNVRSIIQKGIKNNKTARQMQAQLEKTMKLNRGKAKAIARTESNYYKSESKLQVGSYHENNGQVMIKTWIYTYLSNEHRSSHVDASGQKVVGMDAKFKVGDYSTVAPQHFGIASQDINCSCDYKMEYEEKVDTNMDEYGRYKKSK